MGITFDKQYQIGFGRIDYKTLEHRNLPYKRESFNDQAAIDAWVKMGYTQTYFTGEMYDMKNPQPEWFDFEFLKTVFKWEHLSWSFYKMTTGVILPRHVDEFVRFKELYPDAKGTICRALIMLEDWKPGHYLDLGRHGIVNWKAGDYAWWTEYGPHSAANLGIEDRYTLQLTGFRNDS